MRARRSGVVMATLVALLTLVGLEAPASAASAAPGSDLVVTQDASGQIAIQQEATLRAGIVRVQITSSFAGADPETFQLLNGATLAQMDVKINEAGQGGAVAAAAMRWFEVNTRFFGGLSAPGTISYRTVLPAGDYYVAQVNNPSATARSFRVVGNAGTSILTAGQAVTMVESDTFVAASSTGQNQLHAAPVVIANASRELHFARFVQVLPGTTNADVQAWLSGTGSDPTLPGGQVLSFGTQTPARAAVVDLSLSPGTYMLLDFIPDDQSGTPHAFAGMHLVVTVS